MTDRTTKILLAAIALGLFLNAGAAWSPVAAQDRARLAPIDRLLIDQIVTALDQIDSRVAQITEGTCANRKLC